MKNICYKELFYYIIILHNDIKRLLIYIQNIK